MGGKADFIPFSEWLSFYSAGSVAVFSPQEKYSIPASLSTVDPFLIAARGDKIFKIHSSEFQCRLSLRWKMDVSSAA
jgi:hypothetical protein